MSNLLWLSRYENIEQMNALTCPFLRLMKRDIILPKVMKDTSA